MQSCKYLKRKKNRYKTIKYEHKTKYPNFICLGIANVNKTNEETCASLFHHTLSFYYKLLMAIAFIVIYICIKQKMQET